MGYAFSEKYDPHEVERWAKDFWEKNNIYEKLKNMSIERSKRYYFIDGPPYPSSPSIHPGTAWNKILKDSYLRFWRLRGYNVHDVPGYDMHGLPIEHQVEKILGITSKKEIISRVGIQNFVEKCREFVTQNAVSMTKIFKDLGVFMDWSNPYMTIKNEYIEEAWKLIKKADEKGLLERELRVVHWCPRCETVLADYEVSQEYKDLEDPSIYVMMPVKNRENEYLVIWTTTPWTLPANIFIMARGSADYVRVKIDGKILIMAEALYRDVLRRAGIKSFQIVEVVKGKDLEGLEYTHPLKDLISIQEELDKYHKVVIADEYVSLSEGTGLVHAAPGHGAEDFEVARRHGIPVYSLIDDSGRFIDLAGKYAGKPAREANKEIIEDLRSRGALLHEEKIVHRYPLCWRCKTPLLLRATPQWVIKVSKLRDKMLREIEKIRWIPRWAYERTYSLVSDLQDWVISRQRFWGTPLPIWICTSCGHKIVVGSVEELKRYSPNKIPEDLHRPWIDEVVLRCPRCGGVMKRVEDVADVWLDSGVAFYASLGRGGGEIFDKEVGEIDMIVEGHDQTRGWFFSTIRSGLIMFDRKPVKTIVSHGFMLDEKGREMHKSLGNFVEVPVIIEKVGRDPFRLFLLLNTVWEDMRFSIDKAKEVWRDLNIIWNVYNFARSYMEIDRYVFERGSLKDLYDKNVLREEDRWLLSRFYEVVSKATEAMENYRVHEASKTLLDFIEEDVSRWYLRIIRRRVWSEEESIDKKAVYTVLFTVLRDWLIMFSIITPHLAEYLYHNFVKRFDREAFESINFESWPEKTFYEVYYDKSLSEAFELGRKIHEMISTARMRAGLKLRMPVSKCVLILRNKDHAEKGLLVKKVLEELQNCREIVLSKDLEETDLYIERYVEPNIGAVGRDFKKDSPKIIDYIKRNSRELAKEFLTREEVKIVVDGVEYVLRKEHVTIIEKPLEGYSFSSSELGYAIIDTRLSEDLLYEGLAREIVRRIQVMRKEKGLGLLDEIKSFLLTSSEELRKAVEKKRSYIMTETRSVELVLSESLEGVDLDLVREWDVEDEKIIIGIKRV